MFSSIFSSRRVSAHPRARVSLIPSVGAKQLDDQTSPWLSLHPLETIRPGGFIRLRYSASILTPNRRPLIRIVSPSGERIEPMAGAMFGAGEWTGSIPEDVSAIEISPAPGDTTFRLDAVETVSPARLLIRGALSRPGWLLWAARTALGGAREDARRALRFAAASAPLSRYHDWHARMARPLEPDGIDRPLTDWASGLAIRLLMPVLDAGEDRVDATLRSLRAQLYPRWSLSYVLDEDCGPERRRAIAERLRGDGRVSEIAADAPLPAGEAGGARETLCGVIRPGDLLPAYALAAVAEAHAREPRAAIIYGDEDAIGSSGRLHSPRFLPDYGAGFQSGSRYFGDAVWFRAGALSDAGVTTIRDLLSDRDGVVARIAERHPASVHHVRHVLYRRAAEPADPAVAPVAAGIRSSSPDPAPEVAVVVLTRDNAACLSQCIAGLTQGTDYPGFRITLVDNGSVKPDALALLRNLRSHPRIDLLRRPGPFNYAALCNEAARASTAPVLLFLNDDIVITDPGWLRPLVALAVRPDVGAAGARLLFPDGRIQHAGVVLGLGGIAGHLYRRERAGQPGYLDALTVVREVSAVTGACLAVERAKFDAIGGFDAANLPVELNDVDLCLRLAARGHATVWTPQSTLIHHESATRGDSAWSAARYRAERDYFVARWQEAIRDDPYFHPCLSLFSYDPRLS